MTANIYGAILALKEVVDLSKYTLGFDIGGTKCAVILGKGEIPQDCTEGFIIDKIKFDTIQPRGWHAIVEELLSSAETSSPPHRPASSVTT